MGFILLSRLPGHPDTQAGGGNGTTRKGHHRNESGGSRNESGGIEMSALEAALYKRERAGGGAIEMSALEAAL